MPSYLVLARKYRPARFSEVIGQNHVTKTLMNALVSGRVAHAFLFCGVRGVGKTTIARILAKALNCSGRQPSDPEPCNKCLSCQEINRGASIDVQEIDGASNTSVDNIREINENLRYPPASSPYRVIIIDEVHMISVNAFNALLKTLEEPPAHAKFIFATTESHKVPATINSRCQRFNFRTISLREIISGMAAILEKEGIEASEEALALIAREAQGSFRDALSLLDQVAAFGSTRITEEDVLAALGISGRASFSQLARAIIERRADEALLILHKLFQDGSDPEQFLLDFIHYMRNMLMVKTLPQSSQTEGILDAPQSELSELEELASLTSAEQLQLFFSLLLKSEGEIRRSLDPWIFLEMTVLRAIHAPDVVDLKELLQRIDGQMGRASTRPPQNYVERRPVPQRSQPSVPVTSYEIEATHKGPQEHTETDAQGGFTITGIMPVASGPPDEVWLELRNRLAANGCDRFIVSLMEHGSLISYGPKKVEIGFHKAFYSKEFESRLQNKAEVKEIFNEFFGGAQIKVLNLTSETTLASPQPYDVPSDGQSDLDRALKSEALENPITKAVLAEFDDAAIEDIRIIAPKG